MTSLILAAALAGQSPTPQAPSPQPAAAVPTPQGWGPPPAAPPAQVPAVLFQTAPQPIQYHVTLGQPATYPLQVPSYAVPAVPAFAPASSQFSAAAAPFAAPAVQSQAIGIGTVGLVGATYLVDNPWIGKRIVADLGKCLAARGNPVLRPVPAPTVPTLTLQPTAPSSVVAAPVMLSGQAMPVTIVPKQPHATAFGRWFWGE